MLFLGRLDIYGLALLVNSYMLVSSATSMNLTDEFSFSEFLNKCQLILPEKRSPEMNGFALNSSHFFVPFRLLQTTRKKK